MPEGHLSLARHPESSSDLPMAHVATISGFRSKGMDEMKKLLACAALAGSMALAGGASAATWPTMVQGIWGGPANGNNTSRTKW